MKMNKKKGITSKLLVVFLVLLETVVEIRGAPVSTDTGASDLCPPPFGICRWEPEDTCTDHSECKLHSGADKWIGLCCPHACEGKKVCRDVRLPTPSTTIRPTTEYITTTEYTTQPSTKSSTTDITTSTTLPTNPVTTQKNQFTTTTSSTNKPTIVSKATSTAKYSSTQEPSTTQSRTTTTEESKSTIALPTTDLETTTTERTTELPTTTRLTTTEMPTTKLPTTISPSSTTPTMTVVTATTTQEPRPGPSVCSHSGAKDILFIIDGTVNYRQYWVTRKKEWKQTKHFIKEVVSELNGDNFRVGVMQYGGRREPRMEVDLWEGTSTADLMYQIDNIRQIGGVERITGKSLAIASNKFYELNSLYERASAHDIVVLITRGRPSDREQTFAEVEMLKRKMIRVIAIGLGPYPRYLARSLRKIASFTQDAIASKYSELANKKMDVLEKICLPVKLPATESLCGNKKYDIHFVLDGSRSINPSDFDNKRKFLKDAFFLLESPSSDLNIGMMQFSTVEKTEKIMVLQKHSLNEEIKSIENMEYHSGRRTMLGDALSQVNDEVFNGHGGDRSAVENVLVIFSDGRAHDITRAYREADNMKERNVRIIATTVSDYGYVPRQLRKLATHPKYAISIKLSNTAHYAKKLVSMICQANV